MTFASATQFHHVYLLWGQRLFSRVSSNSVLNVEAVVAAFNQEKALVWTFSVSVIVQLHRLIVYSTTPNLVLGHLMDTEPGQWRCYVKQHD